MRWQDNVRRYRRDLHEIPELAWNEKKTQAYVTDRLQAMGVTATPIAGTGLVANLPGAGGPGRTVAIRADMDALPQTETTDAPYQSRHPGMMHACGHDGHMAIVLGLAERLIEEGRRYAGSVRLLFQPAEERHPGGARTMIAEGALRNVDEIFGLHLWSTLPTGVAVMRPGPIMAGDAQFGLTIRGRGGHGSQPEQTQDAVLIAAQTIVNWQTIVSRRIAATEPAVISCGTVHAGTVFNIIAETAELTGTVRALSEDIQTLVEREMTHVAEATAGLYGARAEFRYQRGYPVLRNHPESVQKWEAALEGVVDVQHAQPLMAAEDFSYYLQTVPGAFLILGCQPLDAAHPNHSPRFTLNEAALELGVEVFHRVLEVSLPSS